MKQLLFFILILFVLTLSAQIQEIGYFSNSGDSLFLAKMNNKWKLFSPIIFLEVHSKLLSSELLLSS